MKAFLYLSPCWILYSPGGGICSEFKMGMAYAKYLIDRYTRHGENRFINVLRQGICRASDRVAGDILSIADVRWLDGIDEAKRLSSRIKKLKQRVKGDSGGNETVDSLRDEISGLQKDMKNWEDLAPCPHCGAILPVGAQFCPDCGKEI